MGIFKKSLAIALAALMLISVFSVVAFAAPAEGNYIIAGVAELCGNGWAPADEANKMDLVDGVYTKTYENVAAMNNYQFKVTDGSWDNAWGVGKDNFVFNVTEACDVTITFDPAKEEVTVTGANVVIPQGFNVEKVIAVGDNKGDDSFLNGISWKENNDTNAMTTEDGKVYTITFKGVEKGFDYGFKFAVNGTWASNFGALKENPDGASLEWDGNNILFDVELDKADVTLTLDLTNFDYDNGKTGATYKIDIVEASEEETTAAPEEETTTAAQEETTTAAPAEDETTDPATPEEPATTVTDPASPDTPATPDDATGDEKPATPDETEPAKPIVPGFYLVGSEEVCGAEWGWESPWLYGEPMKQASDGTYFQVVTNVKASAGNVTEEGNDIYVFKVVYVNAKGAKTWHPGGMGNNTMVTVAEDNSTILFQFKLLASNPEKEGSDPEAVIATVYGPNDTTPDFTDPTYPEAPEETTVEPATTEPTTVEPTTAATQPTTKKTTTAKKANTLKVKKAKKTYTIKASKLKKKAVKIKISKLLKVTKAKGAVTYAKVKKGSTKKLYKKLTIKKKSGKITIKKGKYAKNTYKIKIKVKAAGNKSYKKGTATRVVKIKIK